jgi:hypothetical protein
MNRFLINIVVVLSIAGILLASNFSLDIFTARSDGSAITVEFKNSADKEVSYYEIERSGDNTTYKKLAQLKSKGDASSIYRFVDRDALMSVNNGGATTEGSVYSYRIRAINTDNSIEVSKATYVTHNVSSVKRTWGMLKELFK